MRALLKSRLGSLDGMIGHRGARILKTGGWVLTARLCAAINLFVCVPFVLDALGPRHFGAWAAVVSVITLSNFLDFGLGNGAMNLIAGAKGGNRPEQISGIIATAYASLLKTTGVLALSFIAVPFLPWHRLLGLPVEDAGISMASVAIVLCAVLVTIPLNLASKLQLGLGVGGKAFRWQAAGQLLTATVVILLAKAEYGLPALVAGSALVPTSALLMNTQELLKSLPKPEHPYHTDHHISKQIRHEGGLFFILQLCAALAFSPDLLLITSLSGAEHATDYSIVQRAFSLIPMSLGLFWVSLWPTYREALAAGHYSWVFDTFKKSTFIAFFFAITTGIIISALFDQISRIWIGHSIYIDSNLILSFAGWHVIEALGTSMAMLLNASSIIRPQIIFVVFFALACLILKATLAAHGLFEYMPLAASLTYLFFYILPILALRKKLTLLISIKAH